jgi:hypothetical protein
MPYFFSTLLSIALWCGEYHYINIVNELFSFFFSLNFSEFTLWDAYEHYTKSNQMLLFESFACAIKKGRLDANWGSSTQAWEVILFCINK